MDAVEVIVRALVFAGIGLLASGRMFWPALALGVLLAALVINRDGEPMAVSTLVFSIPPYLMGRLVRLRRDAERELRIRVAVRAGTRPLRRVRHPGGTLTDRGGTS